MRVAASIIFLAFLLHSTTLRADVDGTENDRRLRYGEGLNNDGAAYIGDQKTKQQLTPNMMGHYAQSQMHFATGNIPMGMMEQRKGDMLKKQIEVNEQSADKNRDSEKLLYDYTDKKVDAPGAETAVRTVDKDRLSNKQPEQSMLPASAALQAAAPGAASSTASAGSAIPSAEQLAELGPAQVPVSSPVVEPEPITTTGEASVVSLANPEPGSDWRQDLEGLSNTTLAANTASPLMPGNHFAGSMDFALGRNVIQKDKRKENKDDPFASIGKDPDKDAKALKNGKRSSRRGRLAKRARGADNVTRLLAGSKD